MTMMRIMMIMRTMLIVRIQLCAIYFTVYEGTPGGGWEGFSRSATASRARAGSLSDGCFFVCTLLYLW